MQKKVYFSNICNKNCSIYANENSLYAYIKIQYGIRSIFVDIFWSLIKFDGLSNSRARVIHRVVAFYSAMHVLALRSSIRSTYWLFVFRIHFPFDSAAPSVTTSQTMAAARNCYSPGHKNKNFFCVRLFLLILIFIDLLFSLLAAVALSFPFSFLLFVCLSFLLLLFS